MNEVEQWHDHQQIEQWHQTPPWHWRYWFGFRMRKAMDVGLFTGPDYEWSYRTFGQHARAILEEQANGRSENLKNLTAAEIDRRIGEAPRWC